MPDHFGSADLGSEVLMDIAAMLADFTHDETLTRRIPGYLSRAMGFECLSMAVFQDSPEPKVLLAGCSADMPSTNDDAFSRDMLSIHRQQGKHAANGNSGIPVRLESLARLEWPPFLEMPFATVASHSLDAGFSLQLTIHHRPIDPPASGVMLDSLRLVALQLARLLGCNIAWNFRPQAFGQPLNQLTDREWIVLRRLDEDVAEKQLAERLGLLLRTRFTRTSNRFIARSECRGGWRSCRRRARPCENFAKKD